jgi:alanyl-tRNA synthetase
MIMQQVPTVFETDLFEPIIKVIEKYANKFYPLKEYFWNNLNKNYSKEEILRLNELEDTKRFRIIADHVRASVFLI